MAAEKYTECWLWAALLRPSPWLMVCWFSGRLLKSFATMSARSEISLPSGFSALGMGTEMDYKVEDDKVKITSPQGTMVMDILADGSIQGPLGIKLVKQAEK